ncbi:hypothetical protein AHAS_Ahas19G0259600 [Arachis hypogaea]
MFLLLDVLTTKTNKYSTLYRIGQVFIFQEPYEVNGDTQQKANFLLPKIYRLALTAKSGSLVLLFFTTVEYPNFSSGVNVSLVPLDPNSSECEICFIC